MFFLNYQNAALWENNAKIKRLVEIGKPQLAFLYSNIQTFKTSEERKYMLLAQKYYVNENKILERKRTFIDRLGKVTELQNLSNSKIPHPFLRKLTLQKVNYLLARPFTVNSDNDAVPEALKPYLSLDFYKTLRVLGQHAIINGITWLQPYYNEVGELKIKRIPSEEILPFWSNSDRTELDGVLRSYQVLHHLADGSQTTVEKVEYHTLKGVWYFEMNDKGLVNDPERGGEWKGHFNVSIQKRDEEGNGLKDEAGNVQTETIQATWDRLPFIPFKYNNDELSLLKLVEAMVDDYDINTSDTSNNLQDVPNSIKVVRNYDGQDKEEFTRNVNTFRTAFVSGDGDMTAIDTPLDIQAIEGHLTRLRKDIYEAGNGVDTQDANLGNASGVALRFRYADLDIDMDGMATEFSSSLGQLFWFFFKDIANKAGTDYTGEDYDIVFNTEGIVNEVEIISACKASVGVISDETILANHPWVINVADEQERMTKQRESAILEAQTMMLATTPEFGAPLQAGTGDEQAKAMAQKKAAQGQGTQPIPPKPGV